MLDNQTKHRLTCGKRLSRWQCGRARQVSRVPHCHAGKLYCQACTQLAPRPARQFARQPSKLAPERASDGRPVQ